jgi:hypothetical protein
MIEQIVIYMTDGIVYMMGLCLISALVGILLAGPLAKFGVIEERRGVTRVRHTKPEIVISYILWITIFVLSMAVLIGFVGGEVLGL